MDTPFAPSASSVSANIGISRARQRVGCSRGLGGDLNRTPHLFYLAQELVLIQVRLSDGPVGREPHNASLGVKPRGVPDRSEEHTSELQSPCNLVCRLLLEKKKQKRISPTTPHEVHVDE